MTESFPDSSDFQSPQNLPDGVLQKVPDLIIPQNTICHLLECRDLLSPDQFLQAYDSPLNILMDSGMFLPAVFCANSVGLHRVVPEVSKPLGPLVSDSSIVTEASLNGLGTSRTTDRPQAQPFVWGFLKPHKKPVPFSKVVFTVPV